MEEQENLINTDGAGAESAGTEAESPADKAFLQGFFGEDYEPEEPESEEAPAEAPESAEEAAPEETEEAAEAEEEPELVDFVEHGKTYSFDKRALETLSGAVGRSGEEFIDIYQKGCGFDALREKYDAAKKDSGIIETLAKLRGMDTEDFRAEITKAAERVPLEKIKQSIKARNPEMSDGEAERFASLELEAQRKKDRSDEEARANAEKSSEAAREAEDAENKLREIKIFQAAHKEISLDTELDSSVIEAFKRGVPLEEAYQSFLLKKQNEELKEQLLAAQKEKTVLQQKAYNKETSPGSAASAAGALPEDPFINGLSSIWGR